MQSGEERGQFGTHKDKSELASFLGASNTDGEAGAPCRRAVHVLIPGLRDAEGGDLVRPGGGAGQLLPRPATRASRSAATGTGMWDQR